MVWSLHLWKNWREPEGLGACIACGRFRLTSIATWMWRRSGLGTGVYKFYCLINLALFLVPDIHALFLFFFLSFFFFCAVVEVSGASVPEHQSIFDFWGVKVKFAVYYLVHHLQQQIHHNEVLKEFKGTPNFVTIFFFLYFLLTQRQFSWLGDTSCKPYRHLKESK